MELQHQGELVRALETLYEDSQVIIPWERIYFWFNSDRTHKAMYRTIQAEWDERCMKVWGRPNAPALTVIELHNGKLIIRREKFENRFEEHILLLQLT